MDRLLSMKVFHQVAEEGSFAAAARKLDLPPAAVTRLVADLEKSLGVRLLQRTTRRMSLTSAGEAYLSRLRVILSDIEEANAAAQSHSQEMGGTVRVLAPPVVATHILAPSVTTFQREYPDIVLELEVRDVVEVSVDEYDLAVVNNAVALPSSAIVRPILESLAVFCAAPSYLAEHGEPQRPEDLQHHRCLRLRTPGIPVRDITLMDPTRDNLKMEVPMPAVMTANHTDSLMRATLDGAGISSQPSDLIAPYLRSGELRRVLAPWITHRLGLLAALPSRKYMPARTRAFLEHLVTHTRRSLAGLGIATVEGQQVE